ncbi:MAG TPA: hypothetical protein VGO17_10150 [Aurantimonas sp.]|jgi:hypothetical protein|nr:hypothetical protein [Aurantimonas sp.]
MRASLILLGLMTGLGGCAVGPSRCYVTLNAGGAPTAEACETGPNLVVRPITETNAAFYVPPYVIGALAYEGFLAPADDPDESREADGGLVHDAPLRGAVTALPRRTELALASDGAGEPAAFDGFWDRPLLLQARFGERPVAEHAPPPFDRLDRPPTIDGTVFYRRPRGDYPAFPLSADLIR